MIDAIQINRKDNVATALRDLLKKERIVVGTEDGQIEMVVYEAIIYGHKLALRDIALGEKILKYGEIIGQASSPIPTGTHAHVHNVESLRGRGDLETEAEK